MLRTLIVDDERLARQKVRAFLEARDDATVVGEAANVDDAIAAIRREKPDLVLLDIAMPGGNGFDVLEANPPAVVFITAHDEHAVRAFEVAAVDYLLKPFDRKRFDEAIERVKHHVPRDLRAEFFTVRKRDRTLFVPVKDVDWIGSEGKYVRIHTGEHAYLVRDAIATVEARLRERQFVRIHRGTIVNLRRVAEVRDGSTVVLRDGTELALSRRFRARWQQATSNW